ncbi:unnamed protein product [Effrenium voratum]|nr:unnamed protein product [Effrenium voratum]
MAETLRARRLNLHKQLTMVADTPGREERSQGPMQMPRQGISFEDKDLGCLSQEAHDRQLTDLRTRFRPRPLKTTFPTEEWSWGRGMQHLFTLLSQGHSKLTQCGDNLTQLEESVHTLVGATAVQEKLATGPFGLKMKAEKWVVDMLRKGRIRAWRKPAEEPHAASALAASAPRLAQRGWMRKVHKKLARTSDAATRVMVTALQADRGRSLLMGGGSPFGPRFWFGPVSEVLGRSGARGLTLNQRFERLLAEQMDPQNQVLVGQLMHETDAKAKAPGAGTSRVRAVLFKAVCDWLQVAPCSLRSSQKGSCAWNAVQVDGDFVVDVMFEPGALYEEGSAKASEYLRRLEGPKPADGAPSLQQNLTGRMLRPAWHVEPWEIDFDRRDRAGRGGFGEVFQGTWAGQKVAIKEVRDASPTDADVCDFVLEISLLSRLSHPNIVRFWRGCVDLRGGHRTLLLVTEWMDRGVLSQLLHESQELLSLAQGQVLAMGIARGVAYLHHMKVLHLDLKSPNVLLNSSWQPKLCDFGLAKIREQTALQTTLRGVSPIWAPPEMFDDKGGGVTEKADVYSFGIILFELASRKLPYADVGQMQLPRVKAKGQLPKFEKDLDTELAELLRLCLAPRPPARPAMGLMISKLRDFCKQRGIDLEEEQVAMEQRGLHFAGPLGSTPHVEQLRRAEGEKRRAEQELARLRRLLAEEEARVRRLEAGSAPQSAAEEQRFAEFCAQRTQAVEDSKFRCLLCRKLFRGPEFVHKHLRERHWEDFLGVEPGAFGGSGSGGGSAVRFEEEKDQFFDADVAEARRFRGASIRC